MKQGHNIDTLTSIRIWENNIVQCSHMCKQKSLLILVENLHTDKKKIAFFLQFWILCILYGDRRRVAWRM
jgi:hypothetical protein